jgi:hypothetical protein
MKKTKIVAPKVKLSENEVCQYCGVSYKRMPVYTLAKAVFGRKPQVFVCHSKLQKVDGKDHWVEVFECRKKAVADGYIHRPDLSKGS